MRWGLWFPFIFWNSRKDFVMLFLYLCV
jgi:hypothetical protein